MSTYSSNLYIELIGTGEQTGTWGSTTNNNFQYVFEEAIVGRATVAFSDADVTLTPVAATTNQTFRNVYLNCTGTNTASRNLIVPNINKNYIVENNTTGGFDIVVKTAAGTGITVPNGYKCAVYVDGTNVVTAFNYLGGTTTFANLSVTGTLAVGGVTTLSNNLLFSPDNTYDIGASGATRPRNLYLAGNEVVAGTVTLSGGTANGVSYLNASKVLTTGSALTFDGTNLTVGGSAAVGRLTSTANNTDNILTMTSSAGAFSSRIDMLSSAGGGSVINASQYLGFLTGGSECGRFDASRNLLVGNTSATATPASGFTSLINGGSSYFNIGHANGTGSGTSYIQFVYNSGLIGSITQNGTTAVAYNTTSDYRLKTLVAPVTGAGERLDALNPVEYFWKSDGTRSRGFFAHEFQTVYAQSVTGSKDAVDKDGRPVYQAMQAGSSEVIADLVAEIQSLRKRLAAAGIA